MPPARTHTHATLAQGKAAGRAAGGSGGERESECRAVAGDPGIEATARTVTMETPQARHGAGEAGGQVRVSQGGRGARGLTGERESERERVRRDGKETRPFKPRLP